MDKKEIKKAINQLGRVRKNQALDPIDKKTIERIRKKLYNKINDKGVDFMEKYYIDQLDHAYQLDGTDFDLETDDNGIYTSDLSMFRWLKELDDALEKLDNHGINLNINEYQDYIDEANKIK